MDGDGLDLGFDFGDDLGEGLGLGLGEDGKGEGEETYGNSGIC